MWFIVAILSALTFGLAGFIMKINQVQQGSLNPLLLGLYVTGSLGFAINAYAEGTLQLLDWRLWIAGLIIGAGSAWGNLVFIKALDYGPASLTSPLVNMNILFVIVMGTFLYQEPIHTFTLIGITLLLAAVILISIRRTEQITISEKRWFMLICIAIMLFTFRNGGLKVTAVMELENTPILFISYALSACWFAGVTLAEQRKSHHRNVHRLGYKWGLLAGLFSYVGLQLYSIALQIGPSNIVAPIFATNSLVVAFGSIWLFKERLSRVQFIALICLMAGLVLVRLG